ncbi:MAG: TonB-dependent receptor [Prevotella sp.]|nr:TonB-dependent receptor [Prevotella sp.]
MNKQKFFTKPAPLRFKQFSRKGYALFSCIGREVIICTLSVATLTYAKADGISVKTYLVTDSMRHEEVKLDEVLVLGSRAPLSTWQSGMSVEVITREEIERAEASTINDVLKLATGVDVRQRGGFGVQTDISINGGTFDQIVILLNGVNISNPQTGHNATDFPVSLNDIERIEIIEGAASRVFGASAFSGAINIVTRKQNTPLSSKNEGLLGMEGGSFGTFGLEGSISRYEEKEGKTDKRFSAHASTGYMQSDGGTLNSDFKKTHAYANTAWHNPSTDIDLQVGVSSQDYGANTFYSAKYNNQYEETRHWVVSISLVNHHPTPITHHLAGFTFRPTLYINHFDDHYQLIRGLTGADKGENLHHLWVYGASFDTDIDWLAGKTSVGFDIHGDNIRSTALGNNTRTHTNIFTEHNVVLKRWTLAAGIHYGSTTQTERISAWSPGFNICYRPSQHWKLHASWNRSMRVPTFTDLYISNVVQQGDPSLKPERNTTFKGGVQYRTNGFNANISAFHSHGTNMIDWVYATDDATKYHALNIGKLDNMGLSFDANYHHKSFTAQIGYAFIHQDHTTDQKIYKSLYALEYLRHKLTLQIGHQIPLPQNLERHGQLSLTWSARWQQRMNGYTPYWKIDGKMQWTAKRYSIYLKGDNLTNHRYFDLGNVEQPGCWLMAGASLRFAK